MSDPRMPDVAEQFGGWLTIDRDAPDWEIAEFSREQLDAGVEAMEASE